MHFPIRPMHWCFLRFDDVSWHGLFRSYTSPDFQILYISFLGMFHLFKCQCKKHTTNLQNHRNVNSGKPQILYPSDTLKLFDIDLSLGKVWEIFDLSHDAGFVIWDLYCSQVMNVWAFLKTKPRKLKLTAGSAVAWVTHYLPGSLCRKAWVADPWESQCKAGWATPGIWPMIFLSAL